MGFTGSMGSGKTLSLTREAYKYYKKGYKIYSNIKFSFPYEVLTRDLLLSYANDNEKFNKACFVVDEIHIVLDSRKSLSAKNVVLSYFLLQTRKKGVKFLYTTQRMRQIDVRLRENSMFIVRCSSQKIDINKKEIVVVRNLIENQDTGKLYRDKFVGNKYFDFYDTEEIVLLT